jgi:hypothetical protein
VPDKQTEKTKIQTFIKIVFDKCNTDLYYITLKNKILIFYNTFIKNYHSAFLSSFIKSIDYDITHNIHSYLFPFVYKNDNYSFHDFFDKINCAIMEFYTYILIVYLHYPKNIYYAGYYHTHNLSLILSTYFNFTSIYSYNLEEEPSNITSSCIIVNKKYFL